MGGGGTKRQCDRTLGDADSRGRGGGGPGLAVGGDAPVALADRLVRSPGPQLKPQP
jgi:hypothetical protein